MRWLEPFSNPISVPESQPIALDPQFDNFWSLESVFALGSVSVKTQNGQVRKPWELARDFLGALTAWETLLSHNRVFSGDLGRREISLREDVFKLADIKMVNNKPVRLDRKPGTNPAGLAGARADEAARNDNIRKFQNILMRGGAVQEG